MTNRRDFLASLAAGSLAAMAPTGAHSAIRPRVVVVGGGMAGATLAKYLRLWSGRTIAVTLIEKETRYTSNILSNLVVTGQRSLSTLYFGYDRLMSKYGVRLVRGMVQSVTPGSVAATWQVRLANSPRAIECDRVVLAPGVRFDPIADLNDPTKKASVVHAWQAGPDSELLRQKLAAMRAGGTFLLSIPRAPYRCPSAPYERVCLVADLLRRNKPGSKVLVLDANPGIMAESNAYAEVFAERYAGIVEYRPDTVVAAVDAECGRVRTAQGEVIRADLLNVIPPQRAGAIVQALGLTDADDQRFAAVDPRSFESTRLPGIHVIGDSAGTTLPKAGHVGNQSAKICAAAIVNAFNAEPPEPWPTANYVCYAPIGSGQAAWRNDVYRYDAETGNMVAVSGAAGSAQTAQPSAQYFTEMTTWFRTLMTDTFA